jgi:hypothetical protein
VVKNNRAGGGGALVEREEVAGGAHGVYESDVFGVIAATKADSLVPLRRLGFFRLRAGEPME